jgi:hypothetical protein
MEPKRAAAGPTGRASRAPVLRAVWVGDLRVIPQPGAFYGGWVTPNLDGKIKGAQGMQHW